MADITAYRYDLSAHQVLHLSNQGANTTVTVQSTGAGSQQQSSHCFATGPWTAAPQLYQLGEGVMVAIATATQLYHLQVQGGAQGGQTQLSSGPLSAALQQQLAQVQPQHMKPTEAMPSMSMPAMNMEPMRPMEPMKPMKPMKSMKPMEPMAMAMGNMAMSMGNAQSTGAQSEGGQGDSAGPVKRFCAQCGSAVKPGDKFCASCGDRLT
ncbi:MAG: zinc ribbon domain-containing protein [Phormidesmis sp.]